MVLHCCTRILPRTSRGTPPSRGWIIGRVTDSFVLIMQTGQSLQSSVFVRRAGAACIVNGTLFCCMSELKLQSICSQEGEANGIVRTRRVPPPAWVTRAASASPLNGAAGSKGGAAGRSSCSAGLYIATTPRSGGFTAGRFRRAFMRWWEGPACARQGGGGGKGPPALVYAVSGRSSITPLFQSRAQCRPQGRRGVGRRQCRWGRRGAAE